MGPHSDPQRAYARYNARAKLGVLWQSFQHTWQLPTAQLARDSHCIQTGHLADARPTVETASVTTLALDESLSVTILPRCGRIVEGLLCISTYTISLKKPFLISYFASLRFYHYSTVVIYSLSYSLRIDYYYLLNTRSRYYLIIGSLVTNLTSTMSDILLDYIPSCYLVVIIIIIYSLYKLISSLL